MIYSSPEYKSFLNEIEKPASKTQLLQKCIGIGLICMATLSAFALAIIPMYFLYTLTLENQTEIKIKFSPKSFIPPIIARRS